jgi:hypothetical protein
MFLMRLVLVLVLVLVVLLLRSLLLLLLLLLVLPLRGRPLTQLPQSRLGCGSAVRRCAGHVGVSRPFSPTLACGRIARGR